MIVYKNNDRPTSDVLIEKVKLLKRRKPKNFELVDENSIENIENNINSLLRK